ncbi:hypothetical protein ABUW04_06825 [Streptacidiphilus sp. N1-10]|uniref:Uncharacterized protein n=1 Tax=Streptacidiphilus jeojiensis TaxID=3229225 RepID=A0ABV6XIR3_9ACTN
MPPISEYPFPEPQLPLDEPPERERAWTSTDSAGHPLRVTVEYILIDGEAGEALARRQAAAIRRALQWLHAHRDELQSEAGA